MDDSIANATDSDVFTKYLKSEDCVAILHNCKKKTEEEMKKSLLMYDETSKNQI